MSKIADIEIAGKSGTKYKFGVYPYDTEWKEIGAVYVVSRRDNGGNHTFIYVGRTDNLKERHGNHHQADCFKRHNRNCLCVLVEQSQARRIAIEADLLASRIWPCNEQ
ncbi:MAG: hypothetical protein K9M98_02740 [Cephaloticoccus sp.]|nr:hypothetical protein [Akkermansiaceae bacterium]MCF7759398.1 hypothetical protein [Cephaloticoccus sp.]